MIRTEPIRRARPSPLDPVGIGRAPQSGPLHLGALPRAKGIKTFASADLLLCALAAGKVAAAVRGTLPAGSASAALARRSRGRRVQRGALLEPRPGQGVLLGPVGVTEGEGVAARVAFAMEGARLLALHRLASEDPLVAVLSLGRPEDAPRGARIARSLFESQRVVDKLARAGLDAFHAGVQIEDVLRDADIVVAPDGAAGNLAFRALHLAAGVRSFGGLLVGSPLPYVDTSRARASFEDPLRLAALLARGGLVP